MTRHSREKAGTTTQFLQVDGTCYRFNHYIDAVGIDQARLIAEHLHGFETSMDTSPFWNGIGPARYQIRATEVYIPNNQTTPGDVVERGRRVIGRVLEQVPGTRYSGFDRTIIDNPEQRRDGKDDGDGGMALPLPIHRGTW
jgi:hypothetical protein